MKEKTTKKPSEEMRAEYDFSGGVRGKHAGKDIRIVGARQSNPKHTLTCPYCASEAHRTKKDVEFKRRDKTVRLTGVPVIVCEACGKELIEGEVFTRINEIADAPDMRARRRA